MAMTIYMYIAAQELNIKVLLTGHIIVELILPNIAVNFNVGGVLKFVHSF